MLFSYSLVNYLCNVLEGILVCPLFLQVAQPGTALPSSAWPGGDAGPWGAIKQPSMGGRGPISDLEHCESEAVKFKRYVLLWSSRHWGWKKCKGIKFM